jgi:hypothetical protein
MTDRHTGGDVLLLLAVLCAGVLIGLMLHHQLLEMTQWLTLRNGR